MRTALIAAAALAAAVGAPAQAGAAAFYVDDDSPGSPVAGCTSPPPAQACRTINDALADARGAPGSGDVIRVAPGLYEEPVELGSGADAGTALVGAGTGTDPSAATIIQRPPGPGSAPALALGGSALPGPANVVARNLRVQVPAGVSSLGVRVGSPMAALDDVAVELLGATPVHVGVEIVSRGADAATIDGLTVSGGGVANGISASSLVGAGPAVVRDSVVASDRAALTTGGTVRVQRSVLRTTGGSGNAVFAGGDLTLDSTLVTGGVRALEAYAGFGATTATLRHVTLDPGAPKAGGDVAVSARADPGATVAVLLADSIALGPQQARGADRTLVRCTSSDVPDQAGPPEPGDGTVDCPSTPGNARGNSSSTPASLLMPALDDWRLVPGSPAVDTGSTVPLAAGESTTDLAGNPRALDGNGDCVARRDKGAYELTGAAATCPDRPGGVDQAPADGPAAGGETGVDRTAPAVSRVTVRPKRFRIAPRRRGRAQARDSARRRRTPVGTTFAYRLSETARVTFAIQRRASARRAGGRCRRPGRRNRSRPRCVRWVTVARLGQNGRPGANRRRFSGRVGRRALRRGRYRVSAVARDAAGNRSRPRRAGFRVVRR